LFGRDAGNAAQDVTGIGDDPPRRIGLGQDIAGGIVDVTGGIGIAGNDARIGRNLAQGIVKSKELGSE